MHSISLRQIEIFRAVMTTGNLTEAAAPAANLATDRQP